jgi:regulator of ribonuclease activity A
MTISLSTCDLCDAHEAQAGERFAVLPPVFQRYGADTPFFGTVHTVHAFGMAAGGNAVLDNSCVRQAVAHPGQGRVLLIDAGGATHRAVLGGQLALQAANNGWAGVLVNGAVRDAAELRQAKIPVRALALCPLRTEKQGLGQRGAAVHVADVRVEEGHWLYADEDGILVSPQALHTAL